MESGGLEVYANVHEGLLIPQKKGSATIRLKRFGNELVEKLECKLMRVLQ